ncbi:ABC transporter substrate-binding protein [Cohnella sp. GCM10020058]|uniref:ABC transporter substrate-binding protein n=1 Tax=Cohnella sp. GCM10020058 TaxID=3317330 RepID=UPI00366F9C3F
MKLKIGTRPALLAVMSTLLAATGTACSGGGNSAEQSSQAPASSSAAASSASDTYPENGLPKNEKVVLKYGFFEGGLGREYIDLAMDSFKKKYPNVSFEVMYSPKINTIIQTKIAANDDENMFDLFNTTLPGGRNAMIPLVQAGKLEPQDDLWDRVVADGNGKTVKELAIPGIYEGALRYFNKSYNLPNVVSNGGLFFNKKLFEKYGWNQNPKTWDEFVQLLADIKAKGIIPMTYPGQYPGYLDNGFGFAKMFELAEQNGTLDTFKKNYETYALPQYLAPETVEVWKRIYELGKKGYFPDGVAALSHTQSQMQMLQGQAAMVLTGDWVQNEMKDSVPPDLEWGYMAVPMGNDPDSTKWISSSTSNGNYIWAAKPELNKKWAKEFSLWLWTLDVQKALAEKGGATPVRQEFVADKTLMESLQSAPKAVLQYMSANKTVVTSQIRTVTLSDPAAAQAEKTLTEAITEITSGKKDPVPVLEQAEKLHTQALEAQKNAK